MNTLKKLITRCGVFLSVLMIAALFPALASADVSDVVVSKPKKPALAASSAFDFLFDPSSLVENTSGARFGGNKTVEPGATLLFAHDGGGYDFTARSEPVVFFNMGEEEVQLTVTASVSGIGDAVLVQNGSFVGHREPSVYLALIGAGSIGSDTKPFEDGKTLTISVLLGQFNSYMLQLTGGCNPYGKWDEIENIPRASVRVSWKLESPTATLFGSFDDEPTENAPEDAENSLNGSVIIGSEVAPEMIAEAVEDEEPFDVAEPIEDAAPVEDEEPSDVAEPVDDVEASDVAEPVDDVEASDVAEPVEEIGAPVEDEEPESGNAKLSYVAEVADDVEASDVAEPVADDAETFDVAEPYNDTEAVEDTEPSDVVEPIENAEPSNDAEPAEDAEPSDDTEAVEDTEPLDDTRPVEDAQASDNMEPVENVERFDDTPSGEDAEPFNDTEPVEDVADFSQG